MPIDVKLDEDGDITIPTRIVRGQDLVIQKVKGRVELFQGDWILDIRAGVPWFTWLDETPVPTKQIIDFLRSELEDIEGVRLVDVSVTSNNFGISHTIELLVYLDDSDEPDFLFDAQVEPGEPAVFRISRLPTMFP